MPDTPLEAAIDALVDREPLARTANRAPRTGDATGLGLIGALRAMAATAQRAPHGKPAGLGSHPTASMLWFGRVAVGLACLQIAAGLIGLALGYDGPRSVSPTAHLVTSIGFGLSAAWLTLGGAGDPRAQALGRLYLVVAASFLLRFVPTGPHLGRLLSGLSVQPFMPYFLWLFASDFPRTVRHELVDRVCRWGLQVSMVVAPLLLGLKLAAEFGISPVLAASLRHYYARDVEPALGAGDLLWNLVYWAPPVLLFVPAALVIVIKRTLAPPAERRRANIFTAGFVVGLALTTLAVLLETFLPSFWAFARTHRDVTTPLFFGLLLLLPLASTWAVLVGDILDVRTAISRGARYLLARNVLLAIAAAPLLLLLPFLYLHRSETIGRALSEGAGPLLLGLTTGGALLTLVRDRALRYLDEHFGRASIDLAAETAALTAAIGNARAVDELADLVVLSLTRALQVSHARLYRLSASRASFEPVGVEGRALPDTHALFALVSATREPVMLDGSRADIRHLLPADDLGWIETAGTCMLVPVASAGDEVVGAVSIGAKESGEAFMRTEHAFARTVASALALKLESLQSAYESPRRGVDDEPALVCDTCGRAHVGQPGPCECGGRRRPASVPAVLLGKFRTTAYVGAGAMGVVYRALDTTLDRQVALKTLGRLSGVAADRLAAEARIMAAVAHPNLATIYGVERWRRTPILVLEYLERGSLAARLHGPMPIADVLRLGVLLAPALEQLHRARILHRDIKPTNIGFTRDDAPKLLDFGLASFLTPAVHGEASQVDDVEAAADDASRTQALWLGGVPLAGTPLYLPPEALSGAPPSPAFDLWALALVLFEAIAGRHPFADDTVPAVLARVRRAAPLDLARFRPDCPSAVAATFRQLLSPRPTDRCPSATALRTSIERLLSSPDVVGRS